jgi:ABC-type dipeptide/oligopeptide/nickel transport system permease component
MAFGRPHENIETAIKKEDFFMAMPLIILAVILVLTGVFIPDSVYHFIDESAMLLGGK